MVLLVVFFYTYPFSQMRPPQSLCACALSQVWLVGACTGGFHLDKDNIILSCDSETTRHTKETAPDTLNITHSSCCCLIGKLLNPRFVNSFTHEKGREISLLPSKKPLAARTPTARRIAKKSKGYPNQWYLKWPGYPPNNDKLCIVNYD